MKQTFPVNRVAAGATVILNGALSLIKSRYHVCVLHVNYFLGLRLLPFETKPARLALDRAISSCICSSVGQPGSPICREAFAAARASRGGNCSPTLASRRTCFWASFRAAIIMRISSPDKLTYPSPPCSLRNPQPGIRILFPRYHLARYTARSLQVGMLNRKPCKPSARQECS